MFVPCPSFLRLKALQAHFCSFIITSSTLRRQLIAADKQCVEKIPPFLCCEVKAILSISHTKITSALTVSVTADRRAFILRTHSI